MSDRTLILTCKCDEYGISFEDTLKHLVTSLANADTNCRITEYHNFQDDFKSFWELVGNNILYNVPGTNQYIYGENGLLNEGFFRLLYQCQMLNKLSFSSKRCWKQCMLLLCAYLY